jgi:thymidylate synthase (FAD)
MNVKLVSYSTPVEELQIKGVNTLSDLIAYVARVSNPENQINNETAPRLLKYLQKHGHWSPFEMAWVCMEISTTRDIARQIIRHRSFSFQEFSQRYSTVPTEWELREARLQDTKNRQNSLESTNEALNLIWAEQQKELAFHAEKVYNYALRNGIAKEQARAVLPEGLTPSRLYMAGTVRSWLHYVELRSANGTQKEHRDIAQACGNILWKLIGTNENESD